MTGIDLDELQARVESVVRERAPELRDPMTSALRLVEDLGFTSVELLELATEIALEFDIEPLGEEMLTDIRTIEDVVSLVRTLCG